MKFELVEPTDWVDPPQAAHDGPEPLPAPGPIRAAAGHARDRFRAQADALQATLGRMWEVIATAQAREPVSLPADAVAPANFRPGAFSSRSDEA